MNCEAILQAIGVDPQCGSKLKCIAVTNQAAVLEAADGQTINIETDRYHRLVAAGYATKLADDDDLNFIPDEHARLTQTMILAAIRRDSELRRAGNSAKRAVKIVAGELRDNDRFSRYVPAGFGLRTMQLWKKKHREGGKAALFPRTHERGNRGPRYDALYEETAWDVLEELYLKHDRLSVGQIAASVEEKYRIACAERGLPLGDCGKRCLLAVVDTLRVDDIIKARHDAETSKKLRLQAQFFHSVQLPFDLVEIDCTVGDIHLSDQDLVCIGRPTICAAIDAATGFPLAIRVSLESPREALTVRTLRDVVTDRGDAFFEYYGVENRIEITGIPQIFSSDQGSENSGEHLTSIIEQMGSEWAKNIPGCPEKKPFVERFFRELNSFLQTLPGSTNTKELPNKQRTEKGMLEACLTLEDLERYLVKWAYDVYARKLRRLIHSPLRVSETPTESWRRLSAKALCPPAPEDVRQWFMVQKVDRKLQHYGVEVEGVHYHSKGLGQLFSEIGRSQTVDVRYDPSDIREIAVIHPSLSEPLIVPAKTNEVAAVSFADAKGMRRPSDEAKRADRGARATFGSLAQHAQELAESRGKGKVTSLKNARATEALRMKHQEILRKSKQPPASTASDLKMANQPTPKLPVRRKASQPETERME